MIRLRQKLVMRQRPGRLLSSRPIGHRPSGGPKPQAEAEEEAEAEGEEEVRLGEVELEFS
jgi:hypothetical protein